MIVCSNCWTYIGKFFYSE